jgi:H+-transporting ATPase
VDVLCSDKTGTLTQNKLTLSDTVSLESIVEDQVILCGALASRSEDKDAIDMAVINGLRDEKALEGYQIVHFQPFDPVHKRTEATVKDSKGKTFKVSKGAPQVILDLAANASDIRDKLDMAVNEFAAKGYRSLGVARTDAKDKWHYLGILALSDPQREDCKDTIAATRRMGVNVKMVTGDQVAIGREIARQIGLGANILDAQAFGDTKHHEAGQLAQSIEQADGFA